MTELNEIDRLLVEHQRESVSQVQPRRELISITRTDPIEVLTAKVIMLTMENRGIKRG